MIRRLVQALRNRALHGQGLQQILRRAIRLLLPISGGITLVLLPMVLLYGQSRREAVEMRLAALEEAASLQVQQILEEVASDTELTALLSSRVSSSAEWRQLEGLVAAQLRAYPRYRAIQIFDTKGQPLLPAVGATASLISLQEAVNRGLALKPGELWLSPLFWSHYPSAVDMPAPTPALLAVRGLFAGGRRRGVLVFITSLKRVVNDFDLATNGEPELERGFPLSQRGQVINPAGGGPAFSFPARYPEVWRQMQRKPQGMVENRHGLVLYNASQSMKGLAVVIQASSWALLRGSLFQQPAGLALLGLLYLLAAATSVALAISQQRLATLRQQERLQAERLQAVLASAAVGMGLCEPTSGRFHTVNAALCRFLGRGEAELLDRSWWQFSHPEDRGGAQNLLEPLLAGGEEPQHLRLRFQRPDGETVWGDLALACSEEGITVGPRLPVRRPDTLILQIADVSELVAQTAYMEAAAEAGIVGVWDWNIERDVLTWDTVMYKLYGRRRDQFAGAYEAWASAVHPEDRAFAEAEIQAALKGWRPYAPRFRVIWPDGSIHHLQARSRTSFSADGRPLRMIGVNYDITEQVQREQEIDQQRAQLAATLNALVDPQLFLTQESELRIAEANPAAAHCFGRSGHQLIGRPLAELLPPQANGPLLAKLEAVARPGEPLIIDDHPLQLATADESLWVDLRAVTVRNGVALSFRDVSERHRAHQQLAASEERFRLLAANVIDVVFLLEVGRILWIAPGISSTLGWLPGEWKDRRLEEFCHPDDQSRLLSQLGQVEQGQRVIVRVRLRDSGQRWHWLEIHVGPYRNAEGAQQGLVGAMRLVDDEVAAEAELKQRARTDALTGLLNRQEIMERLEWTSRNRRHGDGEVALLFCDIDHFKQINDRHGHSGGDAVLQALAQRLQHGIRNNDQVGRLGGDEMLVVLPGVPSLAEAEAIAVKIHQTARTPLLLPSGSVHPTLSIGVTLIKQGEAVEAVVARADEAMYEAKRQGRDRVIAFA